MNEEPDRLTTNISTLIDRESRHLVRGVGTISDALSKAGEHFAAAFPALRPGPADAGTPPADAVSLQLVRVMNDASQAVPVRLLGGRREERRQSGSGGFLSSVIGGVGSFLGGVVGGLVAPFTAPMTATALQETMIKLGDQVLALARDLSRFVLDFVKLLFQQLHSAGIFPLRQLFESLLDFIDRGTTIVIARLRPVLDWVGQVLEGLTGWLGGFLGALSQWLQGVLNALPRFLGGALESVLQTVGRAAVNDLVRDAVRSAVDSLVAVFSGFLIALGNVILVTGGWLGEWIAYSIGQFFESSLKPPASLGPQVSQAAAEGFKTGREFGSLVAQEILGPAAPSGRESSEAGAAKPRWPRILLKGPDVPKLELPALPTSASPKRAAEGEGLTLKGDIKVEIAAQTVDLENADETARRIAGRTLEELRRLAARELFRRGLPTPP